MSFDGLTNVMLKWMWCGSEGRYDDLCLWVFIQMLTTFAKF